MTTSWAASDRETETLWRVVDRAHLFASRNQFLEFRAAGPWRVRIAEPGDATIVARWRQHLDLLWIRGLWAPPQRIGGWLAELGRVAGVSGLSRVVSPLLTVPQLAPYLDAGLEIGDLIVALQAAPALVRPIPPPDGVTLREGTVHDLSEALVVDAESFAEFWRYGRPELAEAAEHGRFVVAESEGKVVGYTLCTVGRASAVLSRIAVAPSARRSGIASALLARVASDVRRTGATAITLCTQESNEASRALYRSVGFVEVDERYAMASGVARPAE